MDIKQILQNNGIEEGLANQVAQAINSELPKHFVKKEQYNKKVNTIDSLQEQINDFEARKNEPNKFEELYNNALKEIEGFKTKEVNSKKISKIKEELKKANYTDEKIIESISRTIDLNSIEMVEGKLKGFDIANIDDTFGAFKTQIIESGHQGATPPSNTNKDGYSRSEISKMTPQQINKLYKEDPSFLQKIH